MLGMTGFGLAGWRGGVVGDQLAAVADDVVEVKAEEPIAAVNLAVQVAGGAAPGYVHLVQPLAHRLELLVAGAERVVIVVGQLWLLGEVQLQSRTNADRRVITVGPLVFHTEDLGVPLGGLYLVRRRHT